MASASGSKEQATTLLPVGQVQSAGVDGFLAEGSNGKNSVEEPARGGTDDPGARHHYDGCQLHSGIPRTSLAISVRFETEGDVI